MAYNLNGNFQQQLQDLARQYQQLSSVSQQPPFQQMVQPQQITFPVQPHQVKYVEGIEGAYLYQENMPANSSEIIMDKEENLIYYVSKDANGTPAKHIKKASFVVESVPEEEPMFLTRKDFEDFKEEIRKMLIENSQPKQVVLSSSKKTTQGEGK